MNVSRIVAHRFLPLGRFVLLVRAPDPSTAEEVGILQPVTTQGTRSGVATPQLRPPGADCRAGTASSQDGRCMKVLLRNPRRELDVDGPVRVDTLLRRLEINRESVLVIRSGELVPGDAELGDDDVIEIRPVISGGA